MTWRRATVAPDRTHHVVGGRPMYDARFDEVLNFHEPGLAAVAADGAAWHVDESGRPVYAARFLRTFGFYEDRAAVVSADGWHHVLSDGSPLSVDLYDWCGNFQDGRCAVRSANGTYFHVDHEGRPAYQQRWRYVGDFRDGIAVVHAEHGAAHVLRDGTLLNARWFADLDVFHKGFARARDAKGWTHVDRSGLPAYARRFAAIEPFYNGQALVQSQAGVHEIIDERGETLVVVRPLSENGPAGDDERRGVASVDITAIRDRSS